MKKIKSANNQLFEQILSVNKQKEDEFNNGQDGAIILSLLVMFFVPFWLLNEARSFIGIDYSFSSAIVMLVISGVLTTILYRQFKIGAKFAQKHILLDQLLSRYIPKNKTEYQKLQEERKANPANFFLLVNGWVETEKQRWAR